MEVKVDDEPLFDYLDDFIESMPLEVLEQARSNTIQEDGDTSILDQAIKNKKEKELKKQSLFGLFSSTKDKKIAKSKDYNSYQYEEEELEDDDYHYEDLD